MKKRNVINEKSKLYEGYHAYNAFCLVFDDGWNHFGPDRFRWRYIHGSVGGRNLTTNYGPYFADFAYDYNFYTGLTLYWSSNQTLTAPFSGDVAFSEANYGNISWIGNATGYTVSNQPCSNLTTGAITGNCTMTNGVDYGWIRFNTYYNSYSDYQMQNMLRHEFGHILGLGHGPCDPAEGVMAPSIGCIPMFITLQPTEASLLDFWY
jgi:hypothetical protein